jgi:AcrR family transcriptional regulator
MPDAPATDADAVPSPAAGAAGGDGGEPAPAKPGRGRPPRISRAMIAEAAHEIGLDGLTLKAVAARLGVSISALYHHVSSKDDLMRLAAEHAHARVPLPQDRGQHWALWLAEWARYNCDAFLADPGLLTQYLDGAISAETIAGNVDAILGVLVRQGFTVLEANDAYELVSTIGLGTAVATLREQAAADAGLPLGDEQKRVMAEQPDAFPHLRRLHHDIAGQGREPFSARVATVIYGIALRRGLDLDPLRELLEPSPSASPS